jgi:hypothetical protein
VTWLRRLEIDFGKESLEFLFAELFDLDIDLFKDVDRFVCDVGYQFIHYKWQYFICSHSQMLSA